MGRGIVSKIRIVAVVAVVVGAVAVIGPSPAGATTVGDETALRAAFADAAETSVVLTADITLTDCGSGEVSRSSATPITLDGQGRFTITQTCPNVALLSLFGGGGLTAQGVTLSGGRTGVEADGPTVVQASRITGQTATKKDANGIYVSSGSLTLTDTTIDTITAPRSVIGAAAETGTLTATRVTVTGLSGGTGVSGTGSGAIGLGGLSLTVSDSLVADLEAFGSIGLYSFDGSTVMTRTTIRNLIGAGISTSGIDSTGPVVVTDSSITDVFGLLGIGIYMETADPVTVTRSTIARITGEFFGSGILASGESAVNLVNSTVASVQGPAAFTAGDATIVYSTISDSGEDGEGVEYMSQLWVEKSLTMFGSVVVQNAAGATNCHAGSTSSAGYNFSDDSSCDLTATGDRQGAGLDAVLGALADNGGPGATRLPLTGSPLLGAIPVAACQTGPAAGITTDERGLPRPAISGCDIGAVEVQPEPEPVPPHFTG